MLLLTAAPRLGVVFIYIIGVQERCRQLGLAPEVNRGEVGRIGGTVEEVSHVVRGEGAGRAFVQDGRVKPGFGAHQAGGEA